MTGLRNLSLAVAGPDSGADSISPRQVDLSFWSDYRQLGHNHEKGENLTKFRIADHSTRNS